MKDTRRSAVPLVCPVGLSTLVWAIRRTIKQNMDTEHNLLLTHEGRDTVLCWSTGWEQSGATLVFLRNIPRVWRTLQRWALGFPESSDQTPCHRVCLVVTECVW